MAKPADRDPALLLDMLLAARDARSFVWRVVTEHLEPLIAALEPLIGEEGPPDA